ECPCGREASAGSDSRGSGGYPQRGTGARRQRPREREVFRNRVAGAGDGGGGNGADGTARGGEYRRGIGKGVGGFGLVRDFVIRREERRSKRGSTLVHADTAQKRLKTTSGERTLSIPSLPS